LRGPGIASIAAVVVIVSASAVVLSQDFRGVREAEGRKSGYLYLSAGTRALQDDGFQNPGMFAVDQGRALWGRVEGSAGLSCASCHRDAARSMRGVAARYPLVDPASGQLLNLELRINDERRRRLVAAPLDYESEDMLALTTFIAFQSRGMPMAVVVDGAARPYFDRGKTFYFERRGQLDLACSQCHDDRVGAMLRGDVISQGQVNGFPIYRLSWRAMASRHRLFEWCNTSVRAEPYAYGSPEYLALELYTAWRGRGLGIETPAVRR
jgi:sulfur-oxidizing protein SoxA